MWARPRGLVFVVPVIDLTKSAIKDVFRGEKVNIKFYEGRIDINEVSID